MNKTINDLLLTGSKEFKPRGSWRLHNALASMANQGLAMLVGDTYMLTPEGEQLQKVSMDMDAMNGRH